MVLSVLQAGGGAWKLPNGHPSQEARNDGEPWGPTLCSLFSGGPVTHGWFSFPQFCGSERLLGANADGT